MRRCTKRTDRTRGGNVSRFCQSELGERDSYFRLHRQFLHCLPQHDERLHAVCEQSAGRGDD